MAGDGPINPPPGSLPFAGVSPPPPGVTPNFINPPTIGHRVEGAGWSLWAVAVIVVGLRMYSGVRTGKGHVRWDNVFMVFALILALARMILLTIDVKVYGMGRHNWNVRMEWATAHRSILYAADMNYLVAMMFAKLSILLVYRRLFGISRPERLAASAVMGIVVVYTWVLFFIYAFSCNPPYWGWHVTLDLEWSAKHCFDFPTMNVAMGAVNIITDTIILLLPMRVVWNLQMRPIQKLGLTIVFGTGLLTVAAACVREYFVTATERNSDQAYNEVIEATWLTVELMVGIIAASLPAIGPVYQKIIRETRIGTSLRNLFSRLSRSTSSQNSRSYRIKITDRQSEWPRKPWVDTGDSASDVNLTEVDKTGRSQYSGPNPDRTLATQV